MQYEVSRHFEQRSNSRMLLSEMTVRPWRSIGAVEYIALRRGPVIPEHGHAPLAERDVAGLLALCLSGGDCQISEFRALRRFQSYLSPFETQRLAEPQSCIEKQQSHVAEQTRTGSEVHLLLGRRHDRLARMLAPKQPNSGNALNLLPFVGETQQPAQRCQFAVDRSRRERSAAPGFDLPPPLNVILDGRFVDTVDSTAYQAFICQKCCKFLFIELDCSGLLNALHFDCPLESRRKLLQGGNGFPILDSHFALC